MNTIKKLYFIIASAALLGTSCSKEYLQTSPTDSWDETAIFSTAENAQVAMNGVYRCMTQQYGGFGQGWGSCFRGCQAAQAQDASARYHVAEEKRP